MTLYLWWLKLRLAHAKRWNRNAMRLWKEGRIPREFATVKLGLIAKLTNRIEKLESK